jgi:hypothetical protein
LKYTILNHPNSTNSEIAHHKEDYVTCSFLDKIDSREQTYQNMYIGTKNGFLIKFSFTTSTVEFVSQINNQAVKKIDIYHCTNMKSVDTVIFAMCKESKAKSGHCLKIFNEDASIINSVEEIYNLDTVNIRDFRIFTDLSNDCYAIIQGSENDYYQLNAFLIISPYLRVKQIDLKFQSNPNEIEPLDIDKNVTKQVIHTLKNDKDLYLNYILDFIQISIYSNAQTINAQEPKVAFDLGGFTKIKSLLFNSNKSLLIVYGLCKLDYYQKYGKITGNAYRRQTQTWKNSTRAAETQHCLLIMTTKSHQIVSFVKNVSSNLTKLAFSHSLDIYQYDPEAVNELDQIKVDGHVIALNHEGGIEIIDIQHDPTITLKKTKDKEFRVNKQRKNSGFTSCNARIRQPIRTPGFSSALNKFNQDFKKQRKQIRHSSFHQTLDPTPSIADLYNMHNKSAHVELRGHPSKTNFKNTGIVPYSSLTKTRPMVNKTTKKFTPRPFTSNRSYGNRLEYKKATSQQRSNLISYKDILTTNDQNLRQSITRDIKPDPDYIDISTACIITKPRSIENHRIRPISSNVGKKRKKKFIY